MRINTAHPVEAARTVVKVGHAALGLQRDAILSACQDVRICGARLAVCRVASHADGHAPRVDLPALTRPLQKSSLAATEGAILCRVHTDNWIAHSGNPRVHDRRDGLARGRGEMRPQVLSGCVAVGKGAHVLLQALTEGWRPQEMIKHADYGATFGVANRVKDFIDFVRVADLDLNRVAGASSVERQRGLRDLDTDASSKSRHFRV